MSYLLNLNIFFGRNILEKSFFSAFSGVLRDAAPSWSTGAYLFLAPRERIAVNLGRPDSLYDEVSSLRKGPLFDELARRQLGGVRRFGEAELRGGHQGLIAVMNHDDEVLSPWGTELSWGNEIVIQICRASVEGTPAPIWERRVLVDLAKELKPWYATCHMHEEYWTKNMDDSDRGTAAIGVDIGRALPGLYWQNFFGPEFCDGIGKGRLLSTPSVKAEELGEGVVLELSENPRDWGSREYSKREHAAIRHLGEHWFFQRDRGYTGTRPLPLPGV